MTAIEDAAAAPPHFLNSVEGEIALFRALAQARPVGKHKHFHVLTILQSIRQETGRNVTDQALWEKLQSLYDLDYLDDLVCRKLEKLHVLMLSLLFIRGLVLSTSRIGQTRSLKIKIVSKPEIAESAVT